MTRRRVFGRGLIVLDEDHPREDEHQDEHQDDEHDAQGQLASQPAPIEGPDDDETLCRPLLILDI